MRGADINIAQSRGDAVVELLERAQIAPLPVFYKLLYDYVAGVQTLDATRFGALVDHPETGAPNSSRLFEEFVRPYETSDSLCEIVDGMVRRLKTLEVAIVERREASNVQAAELSAVSLSLAEERLDRTLMREWVLRLATINEQARAANQKLTVETEQAEEVLTEAQEELRRLSRDSLVDPLTSIANRKGLDVTLSSALKEASETGRELAVAVIDVDRFKQFNDEYGHQVGDSILKLAARAILATLRSEDKVGRMGGDEFVAVMPGCRPEPAFDRAEAVRKAVLNCDLQPVLGKDILGCVTVSVGLANYRPGDTITSLLDRADRQLLKAKATGRNRVMAELPALEAKAG